MIRRHPTHTLFPYTTLFRSSSLDGAKGKPATSGTRKQFNRLRMRSGLIAAQALPKPYPMPSYFWPMWRSPMIVRTVPCRLLPKGGSSPSGMALCSMRPNCFGSAPWPSFAPDRIWATSQKPSNKQNNWQLGRERKHFSAGLRNFGYTPNHGKWFRDGKPETSDTGYQVPEIVQKFGIFALKSGVSTCRRELQMPRRVLHFRRDCAAF